jgi:cold shock CspA family protein
MSPANDRLTRIGVFYDGTFFYHVSNFYLYRHAKRARISISGLHEFIRNEVATREGANAQFCQIVDAHYFKGRLSAHEADERNALLGERQFDDVLVREGVTTHYLPTPPSGAEKGVDVCLALEALERGMLRRFDVMVLIAGDGDFVPLVRKLNALGTRVMVLAWDFRFEGPDGEERQTRTSQALLKEVTYAVPMSSIIEDRARHGDRLIDGLFLPTREERPEASGRAEGRAEAQDESVPAGPRLRGKVQNLLEGYGFITPEEGTSNIYFFHTELRGVRFEALRLEDQVEFTIGENERGPCARRVELVSS